MKLAIHFGAGNIGRGFIAPVLQDNNYEVIFVDVNKQLIEQINLLKEYKVSSISLNSSTDLLVENISGLLLEDKDPLSEKIAQADLITTSVGPKFVKDIFDLVSNIKTEKTQSFIAFENMYRASTSNSNENSQSNLVLIDAVVDKIVPPQNTTSLDVIVEEYGSIVLDDNKDIKPLNESEIVSYRNYEHEFYKKLWLLNGLHLKLAYFGLSREIKYIHEILNNQEGLEFAEKSIDALSKAYMLFSHSTEDLNEFKQTILKRFSLPEIQDEVIRIARNPEIKFSKNERFERPLKYLISENQEINSFKTVLEIIFENNFQEVEGFNEFKINHLSKGKSFFYNEFWNIDADIMKYKNNLGD
jgi:mannitol-1-phosphate 5-dehydrogenase